DGVDVELEVTKEGTVTTAVYTPPTPFEIASVHSYEIIAKNTNGEDIGRAGSLALPVPFFPIDPLVGPEPEPGMFGTRYIWNVTSPASITTFRSALDAIIAAGDGTLEGEFFDTVDEFIDHGNGGLFANAIPYPEEVTTGTGWTGDNFVQFSRGYIRIAEAGDYTFGFHSDDGFGLRIPGITFTDDFGNGVIDQGDASTYVHTEPTGDS